MQTETVKKGRERTAQEKISDILKKKMTFSFEVFPPKNDKPIEPLLQTLEKLYQYEPDFISCTFGAGGKNVGRNEEVLRAIVDSGHNAMAHYTCIGQDEEDILHTVENFQKIGIRNMLALRGDFPEGWTGTQGAFAHADRLMQFIKRKFPSMTLSGACYVEGHIQARSLDADIAHLRSKQDNGAEFFTTQLNYDIDAYRRFIDRIRKAGITIPVIVGVMPVLYKDGVIRMTLSNGCSIPAPLSRIIGKYGDKPEEFKKAGKEYTVNMIYQYMNEGIDGLHLYSLNKYRDLAEIIEEAGIRGTF